MVVPVDLFFYFGLLEQMLRALFYLQDFSAIPAKGGFAIHPADKNKYAVYVAANS